MKRFIILTLTLAGLCLIPVMASAQVSIQTPGFGISVGPNGGVGVRVGGVYGAVPPAPAPVVVPAPVVAPPAVVVIPAAPVYPPPPPVVVVPPRAVGYYPYYPAAPYYPRRPY